MTSFQVNTTSSAVSGAPSLQRRFFRSLNVHVFPSGEFVQDSANPGVTRCDGQSKPSSEAKRNRLMSMDDCSLAVMGLKVFGSPNVATTRRPPGLTGWQGATSGGSGNG